MRGGNTGAIHSKSDTWRYAMRGTVMSGPTLQPGAGIQPGQALLQAVHAVCSLFAGVRADVLDAGDVRTEHFQEGSHCQTRAGLYPQRYRVEGLLNVH